MPKLLLSSASQCFVCYRSSSWGVHRQKNFQVDVRRSRRWLSVMQCSGQNADWEKEMDTFRKRTLKPNQLATLRQMETDSVWDGKVLSVRQGVAIVEGLSSDASVGTSVNFQNGAAGVLLWRRNDQLCSVLVLHGETVETGESAGCEVVGVIQLLDETAGPSTKLDYEVFKIKAGLHLIGKTVDYMGVEINDSAPASDELKNAGSNVRLLNEEVSMEDREVISEPFFTGVKAIDTLTPIGRGQNMLILGEEGSGKTTTALDIILAQRDTDVKCIYAATSLNSNQSIELSNIQKVLQEHGAMDYTIIVAKRDAGNWIGESYAAMCSACSIAEQIRDSGGHSLVVVDSLEPLIDLWIVMNQALGDAHLIALEDEVMDKAKKTNASKEEDFDLVEYEGMLVSAISAQRRRFFGSFLQRAAKMKKSLGGGTFTLFATLPGLPATGTASPSQNALRYETLSDEMKAKLLDAIKKKNSNEALEKKVSGGQNTVDVEVIEEFMSISDGQVVLKDGKLQTGGSISRIGLRAYPELMESIAQLIRLDLAQAEDARRYAVESEDPIAVMADKKARQLLKALEQSPCNPTPIIDQVISLVIVNSGVISHIEPDAIPTILNSIICSVYKLHPQLVLELEQADCLTEQLESKILDATRAYLEGPSD